MAEEKKSIRVIYDTCKFLVRKIEEKLNANPNYEITSSDLEPITENFEDIRNFLQQHLILAHDPIWGNVLMNLDSKIDYTTQGAVDTEVTTIGTFLLKYNPLYIFSADPMEGCPEYHIFESKAIAEMSRIVYDHPASFSELNPTRDQKKHMNLDDASDASISSMMEKDIHLDKSNPSACLKIPKDLYTISKMRNELNKQIDQNMSIDAYFNYLEKYRKFQEQGGNNGSSGSGNGSGQQPPQSQSSGGGNSESDDDNNQNQQSQIPPSQMNDKGGDKSKPASPKNKDGQATHQWENVDSSTATEATKGLLQQVMSNLSEQDRGLMPGALLEHIKKMLAPPEINWKKYLAKMIGTIPSGKRPTKMRLNRRQPNRFDLSGQFRNKKVKIVVCIDTSGSMSNKMISYCINEIFHMCKANETEITIVECDARVGRVYVAKKPSDVDPNVSGRGGTCFTPAIEYINSQPKFRDALMVYFTDGYGEWEIPKPKTYKNLWVVLGDEKCLSVKHPYGEVKSLRGDKDAKNFFY